MIKTPASAISDSANRLSSDIRVSLGSLETSHIDLVAHRPAAEWLAGWTAANMLGHGIAAARQAAAPILLAFVLTLASPFPENLATGGFGATIASAVLAATLASSAGERASP